MDKLIEFVLEKMVFPILMFLKKRCYIIPVDTSKNNIVRQNVLINVITMCADWICAILIVYGWNQKTVTYISLMTIALYTFVEQYKIYSEQYKYLNSDLYICEIRKRPCKYLTKYTPNLKNMIISSLSFLMLLFMVIFEGTNYYEQKTNLFYKVWILLVWGVLFFIKTKYIFLDLFDIKEFTYKKNES